MSEGKGLLRTALYDLHVAAGAKIVEFGGWEMPVQYAGIMAEHRMVRESAGLFDLSHMGRLRLEGAAAGEFIHRVVTNDVLKLAVGQVEYSLVCNEAGGILDDILVYRTGETEYLLVVNASNRLKIVSWLQERLKADSAVAGRDVRLKDLTLDTVMIGVQGPLSVGILQPLTAIPLEEMGYYRVARGPVLGEEATVSRTGYTGEDGFEVISSIEAGRRLWQRLTSGEGGTAVSPAGLGARDTLRLEAGMPLYGHELGEEVNPLEVSLGRFVKLEKEYFVGQAALKSVRAAGPSRQLVGLEVPDKAIARQGTPVTLRGEQVGAVTSGSFSPTLERSIAMALVKADAAAEESPLELMVRGQNHGTGRVGLPFYRRRKQKQGV